MTGISTEFLMRLGKEKMAIPHESFPAPWPPSEMAEVPVDAETAKLVAEDMLSEAGARILYGTLAVGRCRSADQLALSANHNIGFCMGQVAGMAAAMAVQLDTDIRSIDVKALQKAVYPLKEA